MSKLHYGAFGVAIFAYVMASCALIHAYGGFQPLRSFTLLTPKETLDKEKTKRKADAAIQTDSDNKEMVENNAAIFDGPYKLINQHYNREDGKWEDFDPLDESKAHEDTVFIVYHRHHSPNSIFPLQKLVEVQSESLHQVLKGCARHIDSVFDSKPMVRP